MSTPATRLPEASCVAVQDRDDGRLRKDSPCSSSLNASRLAPGDRLNPEDATSREHDASKPHSIQACGVLPLKLCGPRAACRRIPTPVASSPSSGPSPQRT